MFHSDDPVQFSWDELDSLENIDQDPWFLDDDSDDLTDEIESATCLEDQMTLCLNS